MTDNNNSPAYRLGIDLGGSKIEVVVLDQALDLVYRKRAVTQAHSYDAILKQIIGLITDAEAVLKVTASIGIGTPGALSPQSGLWRNSNTACLNGRSLKHDIEALSGRPVRIQNDANCFTLSEALSGAGRANSVVFGVIIGTGTGGGIVVNRQLLGGLQSIAGEWGHNPLPWWQPGDGSFECYCGKPACIETFLSGPGLARNHLRKFGANLTSRQIVDFARGGNSACAESMHSYYDQMARSLAHVINILDPDIIVLGGGMSNIKEIYEEVPDRLLRYVFSDCLHTPLVPALHGDASGVFGAAMLY